MHKQPQEQILDGGNAAYIEQLYETFCADIDAVDPVWRSYFTNVRATATEVTHSDIRAEFRILARQRRGITQNIAAGSADHKQSRVTALINAYRLLGHLKSNINPLGYRDTTTPLADLELGQYELSASDLDSSFDTDALAGSSKLKLREIIAKLEQIYCQSIGTEFVHIMDATERKWLQSRIEQLLLQPNINAEQQKSILETVTAAETLEKYLGRKYPGAKRFSLEGMETLIVSLRNLILEAGSTGAKEIVIAMAHRGRLNVLVNILGKHPQELFDEFEGKQAQELVSGDVKYHQGFSADMQTPGGNVHLSLAFNPSHLESVTPVACGSVRARQDRVGEHAKAKVMPIAIHGDAAFAGQGVVMETLNMSQTPGYCVGGTLHIITNNQIGFTTNKVQESRSTTYCSDIGKMIQAPIFHVNADDPEAVFVVSKLALEYRNKFQKDVIIDLIGYRRHGHNEADDPTVTQPLMYQEIKQHPTIYNLYSEYLLKNKIIDVAYGKKLIQAYQDKLDAKQDIVARNMLSDWSHEHLIDWQPYLITDWRTSANTGISLKILQQLGTKLTHVPDNFVLHSIVKRIVASRTAMNTGAQLIDWGYAETLAYASLVAAGHQVRLSGQDCERGTFFHRHAVWHDQKTNQQHTPLCNLSGSQAKFTVINSLLSEVAVLGFEYGYASSEPRGLVIWEAQFGDFANSAQVIIDQFISSGEQKWGRFCGLTMLLPHGYEGQGPEHSSARLERYLQLCAEHNMQVCVPSTPAQIFHVLRRQVLRLMRRPLIIMSPKSLLRHKLAKSSLDELATGTFLPIIADQRDPSTITRVVLCSGKVYY
ncbi:MAG: 2-oxoglutarate dehydrogenase E1 component, partial [Legionellales bacterium]